MEATGLPATKVSQYVKYVRLSPKLRTLVDNNEVNLKSALRAQDAASLTGEINESEAVKLAKEMSQMIGAQQTKLVKQIAEGKAVDEAVEAAKTGEKITQIVVTLGVAAHQALSAYAKQQEMTQDEAARTLIEEGLSGEGLLEE